MLPFYIHHYLKPYFTYFLPIKISLQGNYASFHFFSLLFTSFQAAYVVDNLEILRKVVFYKIKRPKTCKNVQKRAKTWIKS